MQISEQAIKEIKDKYTFDEPEEPVDKDKNWVNILDVYKKVNRTPSELLLLFNYSINLLEGIEHVAITEFLEGYSGLKEEMAKIEIDKNMKNNADWYLDWMYGSLLKDNMHKINPLIKFVFERLLGDDSGVTLGEIT